jgi:nucleotide-binding universal stress UspA family protein
MNFRSILVHVDDTPRAPLRLDVAVRLAAEHEAQLVGVYLIAGMDLTPFTAAMIPQEFVERRLDANREAQAAAEAMFRDAGALAGIESLEWRAPVGDARQAAVVNARYADLSVLGQPVRDDHGLASEIANAVLVGSGRPVLFVPYTGVDNTLGERIVIGWKDSRESARVVSDAMPFLTRAREVVAVAVRPRADERLFESVAEKQLQAYLARHGVTAQVKHRNATDESAGETLLSEAADLSADLIVIGGYSRPRFAELVWGGVTRTMLQSMTVPVVMSH